MIRITRGVKYNLIEYSDNNDNVKFSMVLTRDELKELYEELDEVLCGAY
jgi:hypothetical protein